MNVFSSNDFLGAVAAAFAAGQRTRIGDALVHGRRFRLLFAGDRRPLVKIPFLDFVEPVAEAEFSSEPAVRLGWLPAIAHGFEDRDAWLVPGAVHTYSPSPRVAWRRFPTWESYLAAIGDRPGVGFGKSALERRKKLEKAVGPLRFVSHEARPEALRQCMTWKSQQYRASHYVDVFAWPEAVRLFEELLERQFLQLACLWGGDRLLAVHAGLLWQERFYYWLPAYDGTLHALSPGTVLLLELLATSYERGDLEFDFLLGNEPYKWKFCTDTRLVAPLGRRVLQDVLWAPIRKVIAGGAKRFPPVHRAVQAVRRWLVWP